MFNNFFNNTVVSHGHSECADRIVANVKDATATVYYTNGSVYLYTSVSRRALINLIINDNISLGRWINDVLLYINSKCSQFGTYELVYSAWLIMFHVYYLTNDGLPVLTSRHHDEDDACDAVNALSERMPHAMCDYVYKDTH